MHSYAYMSLLICEITINSLLTETEQKLSGLVSDVTKMVTECLRVTKVTVCII